MPKKSPINSQDTIKVPDPLRSKLTEGRSIKKDITFSAILRHFRTRKNWFSFVLGSIPCVPDPTVETLCVTVKNHHYVLKYHPTWYKYLEKDEMCGVIEHEALHVVLAHLPRMYKYYASLHSKIAKAQSVQLSNIAADFAVNSLIANNETKGSVLPECALLPEDYDFYTGGSYEAYMHALRRRADDLAKQQNKNEEDDKPGSSQGGTEGENSDNDSDSSPSDSDTGSSGLSNENELMDRLLKSLQPGHGWNPEDLNEDALGDMKPGVTEEDVLNDSSLLEKIQESMSNLEEDTKRVIKEANKSFEKSHPGSRGLIPGQFAEKIDPSKDVSLLPIGSKLLRCIKKALHSNSNFKINALNFNAVCLGSTVGLFGAHEDEDKFYMEFGIDTSGSMSTKDLESCLGALKSLMASYPFLKIRVTEFDCQIHHSYYVTPKSKINTELHGRGGTNFNPIFKEISEGVSEKGEKLQRPDLIIVATDGDAPAPREEYRLPESKSPLVWLITEQNYSWGDGNKAPCEDFGKEIRV